MNKLINKTGASMVLLAISASFNVATAQDVQQAPTYSKPQGAFERPSRPPQDDGARQGPLFLIEQLQIDQQQRVLVQEIMQQQHQKRMALHQQFRENRQNEHAQMQQLHQQTMQRLSEVLTPAQLSEFEQLLEQHKPPRPPHHRRRERQN